MQRLPLASSLLVLAALAACDTSPASSPEDAAPPDTHTPDTALRDVAPLDTALPPLDIPAENKDLRDGARVWVGHVIDGDTVHVWVGSVAPKQYTIRLLGLAAPECEKDYRQTPEGSKLVCSADDELFGLRSYELMRDLVENQKLTIRCDVAPGAWCTTDPYDRYLAYLVLDDGRDAAVTLTRQGGAFSYTAFASQKRADICRAEYLAQGYLEGNPNRAQSGEKSGIWKLGTRDQILAQMSSSTRSWYRQNHDQRCRQAMGL